MYIILVSYHTNFPTTHSHSPLLVFHPLFFVARGKDAKSEFCEGELWMSEREKAKSEKMRQQGGIYKIMYILMFFASLPMSPHFFFLFPLSLTHLLQWLRNEMYIRDKLVIRFFPSDRRNVSIWQGRVMCCLAWKLSSSSTDSSKERRFVPMPSIHSQHSFSAFFTTEKYTFSYMKVKGFKRSKCNFFSHFF